MPKRLRRQAEQSPAKVPSKEDIMRQIAHVHEILADPNISYEIKGNALRKIVKEIVLTAAKGIYIFIFIYHRLCSPARHTGSSL